MVSWSQVWTSTVCRAYHHPPCPHNGTLPPRRSRRGQAGHHRGPPPPTWTPSPASSTRPRPSTPWAATRTWPRGWAAWAACWASPWASPFSQAPWCRPAPPRTGPPTSAARRTTPSATWVIYKLFCNRQVSTSQSNHSLHTQNGHHCLLRFGPDFWPFCDGR